MNDVYFLLLKCNVAYFCPKNQNMNVISLVLFCLFMYVLPSIKICLRHLGKFYECQKVSDALWTGRDFTLYLKIR